MIPATEVSRRAFAHYLGALPWLALGGGCQLPGKSPPPREFRLTPKTTFGELPEVTWSLVVDLPESEPAVDTLRIARLSGVEVAYYADAAWVDRPAAMIEPLLIQSFRASGAIRVVGDRRSEIRPDFLLQSRITAFQAEARPEAPPDVRVAMAANLVAMPKREVVGTTEVAHTVTATERELQAIATAFDEALGKVFKRLVEWTLATGEAAVSTS
jgi:cholesterol transport system auxiliary component